MNIIACMCCCCQNPPVEFSLVGVVVAVVAVILCLIPMGFAMAKGAEEEASLFENA